MPQGQGITEFNSKCRDFTTVPAIEETEEYIVFPNPNNRMNEWVCRWMDRNRHPHCSIFSIVYVRAECAQHMLSKIVAESHFEIEYFLNDPWSCRSLFKIAANGNHICCSVVSISTAVVWSVWACQRATQWKQHHDIDNGVGIHSNAHNMQRPNLQERIREVAVKKKDDNRLQIWTKRGKLCATTNEPCHNQDRHYD